jgi:hypothetical protein
MDTEKDITDWTTPKMIPEVTPRKWDHQSWQVYLKSDSENSNPSQMQLHCAVRVQPTSQAAVHGI